MRKILFRGKRTDNGEWVEGSLINYGFDRFCISVIPKKRDGRVEQFPVIPQTVGQYTDLKDKNGVKVFEEDIVKASWGYQGLVEYDILLYNMLECTVSDDIEVIGNIHDNPELLEETT